MQLETIDTVTPGQQKTAQSCMYSIHPANISFQGQKKKVSMALIILCKYFPGPIKKEEEKKIGVSIHTS